MDKRAKEILCKFFWHNTGWKDKERRKISQIDFEYAKAKGVMFDEMEVVKEHDACIEALKSLANIISKERVVNSFLFSLSSREVHLRSALASWALAHDIPFHSFVAYTESMHDYWCKICYQSGYDGVDKRAIDINLMNFERIKWGGIRHRDITYALFDLQQFIKEEEYIPTEEDIQILNDIFYAIKICKPFDAPRQLEHRLKDAIPSNKMERDCLIEIFSTIGILVPVKPRTVRGRGTDFGIIEHWRGEDGYNKERMMYFFKDFLDCELI